MPLRCFPPPIALTKAERWTLAPLVAGYYAWKPLAIDRISEAFVPKILDHVWDIDVIHNARVGREGLSYASWKVAQKLDVPFVFVPYHHPRWVGWNYRAYLELYRRADGVIALTHAEKRKLMELGVREERIFITGGKTTRQQRSWRDKRLRHRFSFPIPFQAG